MSDEAQHMIVLRHLDDGRIAEAVKMPVALADAQRLRAEAERRIKAADADANRRQIRADNLESDVRFLAMRVAGATAKLEQFLERTDAADLLNDIDKRAALSHAADTAKDIGRQLGALAALQILVEVRAGEVIDVDRTLTDKLARRTCDWLRRKYKDASAPGFEPAFMDGFAAGFY
jgi:hypothetical protein